jgi:dihydrofolate reductase
MGKVRVAAFSVSLDGYGAGPAQTLETPLGAGFLDVMDWFFPTRVFRTRVVDDPLGATDGEAGIDNDFAGRSLDNVGAWIMGRNMFGPVRGPWPDESWRGWWGEEPVYHCPVFVLTHHPRPTLRMRGGTDFHFVTDGIEAALAQARHVAGDRDVRIGGGVATVRQYLRASLVDELHLAQRPVLLGRGENLFEGLDLPALGYECTGAVAGERATHLQLRRRG